MASTYAVGTVSVSANATALTGSGTLWSSAAILPGALLHAAGLSVPIPIRSVTSDTTITLEVASPVALSGAAYRIVNRLDGGEVSDLLSRLLQLLSRAFDLDGDDKSIALATDAGDLWYAFGTSVADRWRFGIAAGGFDTFRFQRYTGTAWVDVFTVNRTTGVTTWDGSPTVEATYLEGLVAAAEAAAASIGRGSANGVAPLDADSKVPAAYLPSYVDDVVEANNYAALPATGETSKIYVTKDNNKTWRWSGSSYVEISPSPGSTDSVAEGVTNLYMTEARVRAALLTGLSTATNTPIGATDTVLGGIGKLQAQVSAQFRSSDQSQFYAPAFGLGTWSITGDCGPDIMAAISAAAAAGGGTVVIPAGIYGLATPIVIANSGVALKGAGIGDRRTIVSPGEWQSITRLVWRGSSGATMLTVSPADNTALRSIDLDGFVLDAASLADVGALLESGSYSTWSFGCGEARKVNIWMRAKNITDSPGIQHVDAWLYSRSTSATYSPTGILMDSAPSSAWNVSYNRFHQLSAWYYKGDGIVFGDSDNNTVTSIDCYPNPGATGRGVIFANTGYTMPNGNTVRSFPYDTVVHHYNYDVHVLGTVAGQAAQNIHLEWQDNANSPAEPVFESAASGTYGRCGRWFAKGTYPSIVIGDGSAYGANAISISKGANAAPGQYAVAIGGAGTGATGLGSAAIGGHSTTSSGTWSFTGGGDTTVASGGQSAAFGLNTTAAGIGSLVAGKGNYANNDYSFSVGEGNYATGLHSAALGKSTVASGQYSIAGGLTSTASGTAALAVGHAAVASGWGSVALGESTTATGLGSVATGNGSTDRVRNGARVHASGSFASQGDAQIGDHVLRIASAATSVVRLTSDGASANAYNSVTLGNNSAIAIDVTLIGRDTTTGDAATFTLSGAIVKRGANAAATVLLGTPAFTAQTRVGTLAAQVVPTLAADTTNGCINVSVTPATANSVHWVARVHTTEVQ